MNEQRCTSKYDSECSKPIEIGTVCPYDEDVHDEKTLCTCCDACRQDCAGDI